MRNKQTSKYHQDFFFCFENQGSYHKLVAIHSQVYKVIGLHSL